MSTDTPTTEQEQWVLVRDGVPIYEPIGIVQIVFIRATDNRTLREAICSAELDPSNVLHVSAYPKVVQALRGADDMLEGRCYQNCTDGVITDSNGEAEQCQCCDKRRSAIKAALSAVHPAQGDKG